MTDTDIIALVNKTLIDEFELDEEKLTPDASIRDDLGLDSLDIVDMVVTLEMAFSFKLPSREAIKDIKTLHDIHLFIMELRDSGVVKG